MGDIDWSDVIQNHSKQKQYGKINRSIVSEYGLNGFTGFCTVKESLQKCFAQCQKSGHLGSHETLLQVGHWISSPELPDFVLASNVFRGRTWLNLVQGKYMDDVGLEDITVVLQKVHGNSEDIRKDPIFECMTVEPSFWSETPTDFVTEDL